jgi:hypothetical protein
MNKAHILQEIRRTAAANGGLPLGSRRFAAETGIQEGDWFGVYWARWSDALREAGYGPNKFTERYEVGELLEKYARLAVELGRLPVKGDLRLRTRNDPEFPHETTFARLGTKSSFLKRLAGYCEGRKGYEDVLRWCNEYSPRKQDVAPQPSLDRDVIIGFVYLLKSGRFYKIGKTNAAGRRQYELSIQLPERAETIHVIRTDDPIGIEAYWHKRFEVKRLNGEWFDLDAADVGAFKRRKFM